LNKAQLAPDQSVLLTTTIFSTTSYKQGGLLGCRSHWKHTILGSGHVMACNWACNESCKAPCNTSCYTSCYRVVHDVKEHVMVHDVMDHVMDK
jgi:hypothetical protein